MYSWDSCYPLPSSDLTAQLACDDESSDISTFMFACPDRKCCDLSTDITHNAEYHTGRGEIDNPFK